MGNVMITVNGRPFECEESLSVEELLGRCSFTYPLIVVRLNGKSVAQEDFSRVMIQDGDKVECIHLVAGG